ncbi:MAG: hypothetical protein ABMB14_38110 [Myxococcota bacterium]
MSPQAYSWLTHVHGHIAVLGLAVLLHPVITLRRRTGVSKNMLLSADLGAMLLTTAFAIGWFVYPVYRKSVKPPLWLGHPEVVLRFESKEHLAAMAVALAIAGALTLRIAGRRPVGREAAWILLLLGWTLGVITAMFGVFVTGAAHPGF